MQKRSFGLKLAAGAFMLSLGISVISPAGNIPVFAQTRQTAAIAESEFEFNTEKGCITAYKGSDSIVDIPKTIHNINVTGIEWGAFRENSDLTQVTFPDTIQTIGSMAFESCINLKNAEIPNGVAVIAPYTYYDCKSLETVNLPSSITSIMLEAFGGCTSLTKITIPDGTVTIEDEAFAGCTSLKEITIPASVTAIGNDVFLNCSNGLVIIAEKGSAAENYAKKSGLNYKTTEDTPIKSDDIKDVSNQNNNLDEKNAFTLNSSKITLYTKGKRTFTMKAFDHGVKIAGTNVTWKTSNPKVASINKNGKITAKKKGTAKISATYQGTTVTSKITVKKPTLKLKKSKATIKINKSVKIKATAKPAKKITYKSGNKKIATVSKKGVVKAKSVGKTKITVKANGVKKKFTVTVKK